MEWYSYQVFTKRLDWFKIIAQGHARRIYSLLWNMKLDHEFLQRPHNRNLRWPDVGTTALRVYLASYEYCINILSLGESQYAHITTEKPNIGVKLFQISGSDICRTSRDVNAFPPPLQALSHNSTLKYTMTTSFQICHKSSFIISRLFDGD